MPFDKRDVRGRLTAPAADAAGGCLVWAGSGVVNGGTADR